MTAMDALGPLRCWVVNDGTAGMETQCLGLAEAPGLDPVTAPGRQAVAPVLALRRANRGRSFTVQLQDPGVDPARFDLVIAPEPDRPAGRNGVVTLGALHPVTPP